VGVVSAEDVVRQMADDAANTERNAYLAAVSELAGIYNHVLVAWTPHNASVELTFSAVLSVLVSMTNACRPENRAGLVAQMVRLMEESIQS
jgi:hypothetical protein